MLQRDEDGYPPVDVEGLWAERAGADLYQLDNIPFYARGLAAGDLVRTRDEASGRTTIVDVAEPSGNGTIRVICLSEGLSLKEVHEIISSYGFEFENHPPLIAVHIPKDALHAEPLVSRLYELEDADKLAFDVGCVPDVLQPRRGT